MQAVAISLYRLLCWAEVPWEALDSHIHLFSTYYHYYHLLHQHFHRGLSVCSLVLFRAARYPQGSSPPCAALVYVRV
ncbi:hypothetical protein F5B18DRAFT_594603 [Nemania serpens]|nr:hypothetical protein F5B18DRAFT_594603 [Nemania serpens]